MNTNPILYDVSDIYDGISTLMIVKPLIEQFLSKNPGSSIMIEYKNPNKNFTPITGLTEIYRQKNMRILGGIPKTPVIKYVFYKGLPYFIAFGIGLALGIISQTINNFLKRR